MTPHAYIVGLGSNLGSRVATFEAAARLLDARSDSSVLARSSIYTSAALRAPERAHTFQGAQPDYLNAALAVHSALPPEAFLRVLLELEAALGRVRRERWGPRAIDLDCLWGDQPAASATLTLPHPELTRRSFALAPLLDVVAALGEAHAATLRARYAPALAALGAPELYTTTFSAPALRLEAYETRAGEALQLGMRAHGPLEEAAAALLGAIGTRLAHALALPAPCTQLSAHVARSDAAPTLAARLHMLVTDAVAHAQTGLCFGLASVAAELSSARWIGTREHAQRRQPSTSIEVRAVEVTGALDAEVCASASLLLSKLGESPRDSVS